jgi:hypothetical protein
MNCLVRFLNYYESAIGALDCWQGRGSDCNHRRWDKDFYISKIEDIANGDGIQEIAIIAAKELLVENSKYGY